MQPPTFEIISMSVLEGTDWKLGWNDMIWTQH